MIDPMICCLFNSTPLQGKRSRERFIVGGAYRTSL